MKKFPYQVGMKVVFVTLVDPTGTSGQNIYSRNVASALAGHDNVSLTLVCPSPEERLPSELSTACEVVMTLPEKSSQSLLWHTRVQGILYRQLQDVLRSKSIDLLISTLRPSLLVPPYLIRRYDVPYRILVEGKIGHGVDNLSVLPFDTMFSDLVTIWNLRASERCYVVNYDVAKWARSLPLNESKVEILPHGVDVPELLRQTERSPESLESPSKHEFSVSYVGSFKHYHCLHSLVAGVSRLRKKGIDIELSLVGTGPELDSIQDAVSEFGIDSVTTFHGFVAPEKVPDYIRTADACYGVIDPTRTGSPMKVYEYLANGVPIIATAGEEFDFIEDKQLGVLIEQPTPEAVENAIEELYEMSESERSRMRKRARNAGYEHGHTWAEFVDQVISE